MAEMVAWTNCSQLVTRIHLKFSGHVVSDKSAAYAHNWRGIPDRTSFFLRHLRFFEGPHPPQLAADLASDLNERVPSIATTPGPILPRPGWASNQ